MTRGVFFSIIGGLILFIVNPSFSAIINVPDDYSTIQAGINAAVNGDTVLVAPGTYTENIDINGKNIVVTSLFGADSTTIQASNTDIAVVSFISNEPKGAAISGFTIAGSNCSGVSCIGSSPTIKNNNIMAVSYTHLRAHET